MQYIKFYNGTVSAGATNGELVTPENPIFAVVNTDGTEVSQEIAVRCETGYSAYGDATLSFTGANADKWAFEVNGVKGAYGASAVLSELKDVNSVIKVYAKATEDENPSNDTSVEIAISCEIQAK